MYKFRIENIAWVNSRGNNSVRMGLLVFGRLRISFAHMKDGGFEGPRSAILATFLILSLEIMKITILLVEYRDVMVLY